MAKERLDIIIYNRELAPSREKAKAMVLAGEVFVAGQRIDKPGAQIACDAEITIKKVVPRYVSRGALKLEKAARSFNIDFNNKIMLDVGASTGGYTDLALKNGASRVYAVDVGYGQLDWSLRNNPRVVNLERTNIRYLTDEIIKEKVDLVTIDVSFISTRLVFPVVKQFIKDDGVIVSLIKPQFEAGRDKVGKKGVVRNAEVHREVLIQCAGYAMQEGLYCTGITYSPITGPNGNIEFFLCLQKEGLTVDNITLLIAETVAKAHQELGGKGFEGTAGQ